MPTPSKTSTLESVLSGLQALGNTCTYAALLAQLTSEHQIARKLQILLTSSAVKLLAGVHLRAVLMHSCKLYYLTTLGCDT